jgi:hypothetical protein
VRRPLCGSGRGSGCQTTGTGRIFRDVTVQRWSRCLSEHVEIAFQSELDAGRVHLKKNDQSELSMELIEMLQAKLLQ